MPRDSAPTIDSLAASVARVEALRWRLEAFAGGKPVTRLAHAVHDALSSSLQHQSGTVADLARHPLAAKAQWVDMPTSSTAPVRAGASPAGPWFDAFGQPQFHVVNAFGNEDAVVLEVQATFRQQRSLLLGTDHLLQQKPFALGLAFVCHCHGAQSAVSRVEVYYDLATTLRGVGVFPPMPIGHDERNAVSPIVLHASGFAQRSPALVRATGVAWPISVGEPPRFGSSTTATAKRNAQNCSGIHEAFVQHDPARFAALIAPDAVWIDVPTGEVLNGAVAAAHHDHGNWMRAFPDSKADVTNMVPNDHWVAVQHRGYGTHSGPLELGGRVFPPTGQPVDIRVLDIVEYSAGKATLIRNYYDMGLMVVNLGVADAFVAG